MNHRGNLWKESPGLQGWLLCGYRSNVGSPRLPKIIIGKKNQLGIKGI